jgi:hypothetical protein
MARSPLCNSFKSTTGSRKQAFLSLVLHSRYQYYILAYETFFERRRSPHWFSPLRCLSIQWYMSKNRLRNFVAYAHLKTTKKDYGIQTFVLNATMSWRFGKPGSKRIRQIKVQSSHSVHDAIYNQLMGVYCASSCIFPNSREMHLRLRPL